MPTFATAGAKLHRSGTFVVRVQPELLRSGHTWRVGA